MRHKEEEIYKNLSQKEKENFDLGMERAEEEGLYDEVLNSAISMHEAGVLPLRALIDALNDWDC